MEEKRWLENLDSSRRHWLRCCCFPIAHLPAAALLHLGRTKIARRDRIPLPEHRLLFSANRLSHFEVSLVALSVFFARMPQEVPLLWLAFQIHLA